MTMKQKSIIVALVILVVVVILLGIAALQKNLPAEQKTVTANPQPGTSQAEGAESVNNEPQPTPEIPVKRSNPEILEAITKRSPELTDASGQPVFAVTNAVKTPNAWYVVTVKHTDPTVGSAKVILKDNGGSAGLVLIAGPGTSFPEDIIALPDEVRRLL